MNDGNSGNNYSYTFITDTTGVINPATNQETSSLPEQNILYVTKPDANGTTMTIVSDTTTASDGSDSKTGSGSEGYSDSNKDKEKNKDENKKDGSQTQKEGQKSGIKKQALPYCN
jgi:hypothetical protein